MAGVLSCIGEREWGSGCLTRPWIIEDPRAEPLDHVDVGGQRDGAAGTQKGSIADPSRATRGRFAKAMTSVTGRISMNG